MGAEARGQWAEEVQLHLAREGERQGSGKKGQGVSGQAPARSGSASGRLVMCGFLTLCGKDFTTRVQVILRLCLLRLGMVAWAGVAQWTEREPANQKAGDGEGKGIGWTE